MMPFIIIFLIIPLTELAIFAAVSEHIGLLSTLLIALLTAIIGGNLVRMQGVSTILSLKSNLSRNKMPVNELFDGICLLIAGLFLITPGFLTDTIGFLLLIPKFRHVLRNFIKNNTNWAASSESFSQNAASRDPDVIDAEYTTISEEPADKS